MDFRGIPTAACPNCGSNLIKIVAQFDPKDYEIGIYSLDAECALCQALLTAPTPLDILGK
jgi:hypothetical protein